MTRLCSQENIIAEDLKRVEFEAQLKSSAAKAFMAIEQARGKMTPDQRERADRKAEVILADATKDAQPLQRRA